MRVKNAMYVEKNIDLNQEFYFDHPDTKLAINQMHNAHCSLFSQGAQNIESTYNRSVKIKMDLPYATHRSLIEPLTCTY